MDTYPSEYSTQSNLSEGLKQVNLYCTQDADTKPMRGSNVCNDCMNFGNKLCNICGHGGSYYVPGRSADTPTILDSGDRTRFDTGAVRDMHAGKGRMDLLPWAAIMDVSKLCEDGAVKYGEHNVDKGIPTHSLCDSAARHLAKYLDGWTDENHLRAAAWNLLWAIQMELKHPEVVDTPYKEK